jgi:erythromycin esterase-like protein
MNSPHLRPIEAIRSVAVRLDGVDHDYDPLLQAVGGRPFVLLGEATHGTREFYRMRADITRRLIVECGFDAVAVEADWPDANRLNRYVRGEGHDASARAAFGDFQRFPRWMWCNEEVLPFIEWLQAHNATCQRDAAVGFYGLDLYSLYRSAEAVISYLEGVDPEQAAIARKQYAALDHVRDPQGYGYEVVSGLRPDCQSAVLERLAELIRHAPDYLTHGGQQAVDEQFFAERNAHVVMSAEAYYREMFGLRASSWNRRDQHMTQTLFALHQHLRAQGRAGRIVVWAHNSHLGDARATQMSQAGEWNVGQLVRQNVGTDEALLVGFTTYTGTVTAADEWGGPADCRKVRPARADSYEGLFHRTHLDRFYLPLGDPVASSLLPMLERAIGVLYRPQTELASHYFEATLPLQFDALFHLDETQAVEPFDQVAPPEHADMPADHLPGA